MQEVERDRSDDNLLACSRGQVRVPNNGRGEERMGAVSSTRTTRNSV